MQICNCNVNFFLEPCLPEETAFVVCLQVGRQASAWLGRTLPSYSSPPRPQPICGPCQAAHAEGRIMTPLRLQKGSVGTQRLTVVLWQVSERGSPRHEGCWQLSPLSAWRSLRMQPQRWQAPAVRWG